MLFVAFSAVVTALSPTLPYIMLCTVAVLATAIRRGSWVSV